MIILVGAEPPRISVAHTLVVLHLVDDNVPVVWLSVRTLPQT